MFFSFSSKIRWALNNWLTTYYPAFLCLVSKSILINRVCFLHIKLHFWDLTLLRLGNLASVNLARTRLVQLAKSCLRYILSVKDLYLLNFSVVFWVLLLPPLMHVKLLVYTPFIFTIACILILNFTPSSHIFHTSLVLEVFGLNLINPLFETYFLVWPLGWIM